MSGLLRHNSHPGAEGSPKWFEQKLRDLRKYLRGRQPPVAAKAIYVAPPSTAYKDDVDTLEAIVLRGWRLCGRSPGNRRA
jgi:hypothetical protein